MNQQPSFNDAGFDGRLSKEIKQLPIDIVSLFLFAIFAQMTTNVNIPSGLEFSDCLCHGCQDPENENV